MAAVIVTPETVQKAIDSLLKWRTSKSQSEKPKLFDQDDEFVYLVLSLKKVPPKGRVNPHKLPLPHSLSSEFSQRCLIIDDRPKSNLTKADALKKIQSENIPISKVLKLSKLVSDYRAFESKRKLCNSYDMFFADKRVVPLLPRLLGKQFFKKKKTPVAVDLSKRNWKEQVEKSCAAALLTLRAGTCSVIRVAKLCMGRDEIVENVVAAIDGVIEVIPKNWGNVRSFHVKLLESVPLPIYQALPDIKLRIEGNIAEEEEEEAERKSKRKRKEESEDGEVSDKIEGKKKKKGRIHDVKYMDDKVGEDVVEDKSDSEDGDEGDDNIDDQEAAAADSADNDDKGSEELVNKKRKKGSKVENGAFGDLSNEKKKMKKSAQESGKKKKKVGKENLIKQSRSQEESGKKEKKEKKQSRSEDEGSGKKEKRQKKKGVDVKAKVKKSKKAV